jgi:hypothetical protein
MPAARPSVIAQHIEAAKRLLDELEQHATMAMDALGADDNGAFLGAVAERDRILGELNQVVETLAQERLVNGAADAETGALLERMAEAAASALESQELLSHRTRQERDRLAAALNRTQRTDSVANQYAAAKLVPRSNTISVTG